MMQAAQDTSSRAQYKKRRRSGLRRGFLYCAVGEIDKSRCVSYFPTVPKYDRKDEDTDMIDQIAVVVKNKPGSLRRITSLLAENNINCLCISTYDAPDFGILRMIVDDFDKCYRILEERGELVMKDRVIAIPMEDKPGAMDGILAAVGEANINIDCMYSYISSRLKSAVLIFRAEDIEETESVLAIKGYQVIRDVKGL